MLASTAFQLHLPRYSTEAILKERLVAAIENCGSRSDANSGLAVRDALGCCVAVPYTWFVGSRTVVSVVMHRWFALADVRVSA